MAQPVAYLYSGAFIPGTLARAEAESQEFTSVQVGFARLAIQGVDTGAANAYVVATSGAQNGIYTDGMIVEFKALNANTTNCTIAVDSGSTVALGGPGGASLAAGAIVANTWYLCRYNSTYSCFTLMAPITLTTTSNTISSAAPTHLVGLTPAGGSSTACAPIDVTFAIDQSIAPTWTGAHTFANMVTFASTVSFASGLMLTGPANTYAAEFTGNSGSGKSFGLEVDAGTNASDIAVLVNNQAGSTAFFEINGAGGIIVGSPTGGSQGVGTVNATGLFVNGVAVSNAVSHNPTATIGLSVVNGSAATFMTSDSAPPLSQAIAPTWTAAHIFTPSSAVTAVTINAAVNAVGMILNGGTNTSNTYLLEVLTGAGSGFSSGLLIEAGTTSGDNAILIENAAATHTYFQIKGDGSGQLGYNGSALGAIVWNTTGLATLNVDATSGYWTFHDATVAAVDRGYVGYGAGILSAAAQADFTVRAQGNLFLAAQGNNAIMELTGTSAPTIKGYGPTAAALVDMTPDSSSATLTTVGLTVNTALGGCKWSKQGNQVMLVIPAWSGTTDTSHAGKVTLTGLPAEIQPATTQVLNDIPVFNVGGTENSTPIQLTGSSGTLTYLSAVGGTAVSGTSTAVGQVAQNTVRYLLN